MLKYTGHPLVDIGVATIAAFVGKQDPAQVTEADLAQVTEYITREYTHDPLKSFLTVAFPNSGFTQPAFEKTPEKRLEYARRVLQGYASESPEEVTGLQCVFTGEAAAPSPFGEKESLPPGRAFRQHVPLLTGEDVINFHPYGDAGLPISGKAMLAIQAMPLGCAKCGGRLLAVHSDNDMLTYHFAAAFLKENRRAVQVAQLAGEKKLPEAQRAYRTLLIETLLEAAMMQRDAREDEQLASLTIYHLTNSGQGADLDIYHLPLQIVGFLRDMQRAEYHQEWNALVRRAWQVAPPHKKGLMAEPFTPRRNWLYEDLFTLPERAQEFLRTYFLRLTFRYAKDATDPRARYSLKDEAALVSWKITARFLKGVLNMDRTRVERIRALGDALASYVSSQNDKRFFRDFFTARRYDVLRLLLLKANLEHVRCGKAPLLTLDQYLDIFEEGEDLARPDWQLARDLVLIRMVEQLHGQAWLGQNPDALPEDLATGEPDTV